MQAALTPASQELIATSTRHTAPLDGIRAIAALAVVFFHVWLYRADRPRGARTELLDQVLFHANAGLICFFVLSGYLLYGAFARAAMTAEPAVAVGPYLRRRAARIVPGAWVCGAVSLLLYWAVGYHAITPSAAELPLYALFLQNYSLSTIGGLNPVMWTLGVEVAFYLTLPLVGWAALRIGPGRVWVQVTLVLGLIAVTPAWNVLVLRQDWGAVAEQALPAYLGSFGMGMLVAVWVQARRAAARPRGLLGHRTTAALLAVATIVVIGDATLHENGWWLREGVLRESVVTTRVQAELIGHLGSATGFALLIAAAACGSGPAIRWLAWRPLAALGTISYGLYLWHLPLLLVSRQAGLLPTALAPRVLVVLAFSVAAAAVSWRWVERPWIERRWDRRGEPRRRRDDQIPAQAPAATSLNPWVSTS